MLVIEELVKIIVVSIMVFCLGFERTLHRKSIGFGSFTLVAIGATSLAITGTLIAPGDYIFLLNGIITSIGFLGAGALLRTRENSYGFTTASTLWATAILGLTIGLGLYPIAALIYLMMWIVIGVDRIIEMKGLGNEAQLLIVTFRGIRKPIFLENRLAGLPYQIQSLKYNPKEGKTQFTLRVQQEKHKVMEYLKDLTADLDINEIQYN